MNIHLGLGTCTMKYSPKVNEELVRSHKVADLHPLQDDETVQGMLEVFHRFERMLCQISGLSRFTLQPGLIIKGKVLEVTLGATTAHVRIDVGGGTVITSSITNEAVAALALKVGDAAYAVIKASDVMVGKD